MQKYNLLSEHLNFNLEKFILEHLDDNVITLALKLKSARLTDCNVQLVLETFQNFKKSGHKLPTLTSNYCWLPSRSYEQSSSELTAFYKSTLFSGSTFLDLCGGLGIDDMAFSKVFSTIISIDADDELNEVVKFNFKKLNIQNISRITSFAEDFLYKNSSTIDLVYIDADRRSDNNARKFILEDCSPNILAILPQLKNITNQLLIKLSPLVDLDYCKSAIDSIVEIHVVAVKNEVKEVLLLVDFNKKCDVVIKAINLIDTNTFQQFYNNENAKAVEANNSEASFFYEPNSAIIKANLSASYAQSLGLKMIAQNANFFLGNEMIQDFIGRSFQIINSFSFSKSTVVNYLKSSGIVKANISKRHFPINEQEIAKQFKLKTGGDDYLFFTQNNQAEKLFFHCRKID